MAGVPALLSILNKLGLPISTWSDKQISPATQWFLIGLGIAFLVVIRVPRVAFWVTRLILGPPRPIVDRPRVFRGPLRYEARDADCFFGRTADAETCGKRIGVKPLFILEGESGSGKSSLLQTVLLPRARGQFHVVDCRCGEDPFGKLRAALLQGRYKPGRRYGKPALREAIERDSQVRHDESDRPLLVCIDQFEELFVTVKDEVRRRFLDALGDAIAEDKLRLVVAIRKDFSDLLRDLRIEVDPDNRIFTFDRESYHVLRSFSVRKAEEVLRRMLDRDEVHGGDPLRRQELDDFALALVEELKRPPLDARLSREDEPRVLPVEIQMVGWTYETILGGNFSAPDLRRRGGKAGLYRDYIEDAKEYVLSKTGVPGATSVSVLLRLISPAGTKWPQSVPDIASASGLTSRQVDGVLQAFAERYLVRLLPDGVSVAGAGALSARRYELMHEHLVHLLAEAPDPALQRARDAEERLRFWLDRTRYVFAPVATTNSDAGAAPRRRSWPRLGRLYAQPIPIGETLRLCRHARDRDAHRILRRNLRGFAARLLTVLLLVALPFGGWWLYETSSYQQVEYVIAHGPIEIANTSANEESWEAIEAWLTALVESHHADEAIKAIDDKIRPSNSRARAYAAIAGAAAEAGQLDAAIKAAASITGSEYMVDVYQTRARTSVARAAAKAGQLDAAMKAAASITGSEYEVWEDRAWAYATIAGVAARTGQPQVAAGALDAAMTAFVGIGGLFSDSTARAYEAIAEAAARAGQPQVAAGALDAALEAAEEASDLSLRDLAYALIARAAARAGQFDAAMKAAEKATNPAYRSEVYEEIAEAEAKAGQFDAALKAAEKATDPNDQARAYVAIAEAGARAGQAQVAAGALDAALKAAEEDTKTYHRALAYEAIAGAAARAGQPQVAAGALDAALEAAEKVSDPDTRARAYAAIAEATAKRGDTTAARKALTMIPTEHEEPHSKALAAVAIALAREGRFYEARMTCSACRPKDQLRAYAAILTEYTKRHRRGP